MGNGETVSADPLAYLRNFVRAGVDSRLDELEAELEATRGIIEQLRHERDNLAHKVKAQAAEISARSAANVALRDELRG